MAVLSFIEVSEGKIKKACYEAAYYGSKVAELLNTDCVAVVAGTASDEELATLGKYGVKKILHANDARFNSFDSKVMRNIFLICDSSSIINISALVILQII